MVISSTCFINVYLPSVTSSNDLDLLTSLLSEIDDAVSHAKCDFEPQNFVFGGGMNVNIKSNLNASQLLIDYTKRWSLTACNDILPTNLDYTYFHESVEQYSFIDYFFISDSCWLCSNLIIDSPINMSDHLPIKIVCCIGQNTLYPGSAEETQSSLLEPKNNIPSLDWNSESRGSYYELTRLKTQHIFECITELHKKEADFSNPVHQAISFANLSPEDIVQLKKHFSSELILSIEDIYSKLVNALFSASADTVSVKKIGA